MARQRTRTPTPPTGFVASAARLPAASVREAGKVQSWQQDAWKFYDRVGELRYVSNWIGNVLSRAELHPAKRNGNRLELLEKGPAFDAVEDLYGGPQGQSQMLQALGTDLCVGGEAYLVYQAAEDIWHTLATGAVTQIKTGEVRIDYGNGVKEDKQPKDLVIRVYQPHPKSPREADAPTRSNLTTLGQIVGYDDHISAQLTSRLAGAGILMMPSEIDFAADEDEDPEATQASSFMKQLAEAMTAPIEDRNSPAAFVPIVVTAPGELIAKASHMKFWSDLDEGVITMREAAVRRLGIGMDVPPEVLLGMGDSNHWNAWLSEESAIKAHLEPRLALISHALTVGYLRPALKGTSLESKADDFFIIADTSNIRTRPDRSDKAIELHDRALLSADKVLSETGFHPEDEMDADEYKKWLLQRIATGAVTPELTAEALHLLGTQIDTSVINDDQAQLPPDHTRTDTGIEDVGRTAPDVDEARERRKAELVASCQVLVVKALERAGNKLRNHHKLQGATNPETLYLSHVGEPDKLLAGAWDCAEKALDGFEVDGNEVIGVLDFYCRGLLSRQAPYSKNTLARLLDAELTTVDA